MSDSSRMCRGAGCALGVALVLGLALSACKTMQKDGGEDPGVPAGQMIDFTPASGLAPLRFEGGNYPNLFGSGSHAIWVQPGVTPSPVATADSPSGETGTANSPASALAANPAVAVIELRLESVFGDTSIAYDVVGLRGMQAYLLTPDGRQIVPAQTMMGRELTEKPQGALRVFGRTNVLVFPAEGLRFPLPPEGAMAARVRLVLEGYDSSYYFEWAPLLPELAEEPGMTPQKTAKAVQKGYQGFRSRFLRWSHKVD